MPARYYARRIERDRFPLSPRVRSFKAILAKLDPRGRLFRRWRLIGV